MTIEVQADGFATRRRIDAVTAGAIVLAVDAMLFALIAVLGVPALIWLFGDEIASWHRLWLVVVVWLVACGLAVVSTIATLRLAGHGAQPVRRISVAAAGGTAVAAGLLAVTSTASEPGVLGAMAGVFAIANVLAARALATAPEAAAQAMLAVPIAEPYTDSDLIVIGAEEEEQEEQTEHADIPVEPGGPETAVRATVDLKPAVARRTARNRTRGPAALHTLAGVRLPPRARGNRR